MVRYRRKHRVIRSLQLKVILSLLAGVVLSMGAMAAVQYHFEKKRELDHLSATAERIANRLAGSLAYPLWYLDRPAILDAIRRELDHPDIAAVHLESEEATGWFLSGETPFPGDRSTGVTSPVPNAHPPHPPFLQLTRTARREGRALGEIELHVTDARLKQRLSRLLHRLALQTIALSVLIVGVMFLLLRKTVLIPIRGLSDAAKRTIAGEADLAAPVHSADEIGQLGMAFNAMLAEIREQLAALEASERRYRLLFDLAPVGICVFQEHSRVLHLNRAMMGMLAAHDKTAANDCSIVNAFVDHGLYGHLLEELKREGVVQEIEAELLRKDGRIFDALIDVVAIGDDRPITGLAICRDITAAKKAEQALKESEARFKTLFEYAPDAFYLNDIEGRFLDGNRAAETLIGYPKADLIGKSMLELSIVPPEKAAHAAALLARSAAGEPTGPDELALISRDGRRVAVEVMSLPIEMDGRPVVMGIARDITERKAAEDQQRRLETQLRHAQKMEAMGTMAGGIAHDFNNILAVIVGYTDLAIQMVPGDIDLRDMLQQIANAGARARDLVEQILTFSRQSSAEIEPVMINPLAKEAVKMLRSILPANIHITADIGKEPLTALAAPTHIQQIIVNLATNAAHAMTDEGGELTIRLGRETSESAGEDPGRLMLTVSDTGCGIPDAILDRIFEPYFTTKETGKGTGLGLAMVHSIVDLYKGTVRVESRPGKSTTFFVHLPLMAKNPSPQTLPDRERPQPGSGEILLVDDEPQVLQMTTLWLNRLGYAVVDCECALDATAAVEASPDRFDAVITDMTMPDLTGDRLAGRIRQIRPDLPIILCTGFSEKVADKDPEALGVDAVLMKPVDIAEMARLLRRLLDGPPTDADGES